MTGRSWPWISGNLIITTFKTKLRQQLCKLPMVSKLYNKKTSGQASVHHVRMWMGLSGLNAHRRRRKYNFINGNTCRLCNMKAENMYHYVLRLVYPILTTPRATLLSRVSQNLSNIPNQCVFFSTRQSSSELHDLLLNGSTLLPLDINLQLFKELLLIHNDSIHNCIVFSLVSSIILWGSHRWPTTALNLLYRGKQ